MPHTAVVFFKDKQSLNRGVVLYSTPLTICGYRTARSADTEVKGTQYLAGRTFAILFEVEAPQPGLFQDEKGLILEMFTVALPFQQVYDILARYGRDKLRQARSHSQRHFGPSKVKLVAINSRLRVA